VPIVLVVLTHNLDLLLIGTRDNLLLHQTLAETVVNMTENPAARTTPHYNIQHIIFQVTSNLPLQPSNLPQKPPT
jgi:hypothetical protein